MWYKPKKFKTEPSTIVPLTKPEDMYKCFPEWYAKYGGLPIELQKSIRDYHLSQKNGLKNTVVSVKELLGELGLEYKSSVDTHMQIFTEVDRIDFWPTTNKVFVTRIGEHKAYKRLDGREVITDMFLEVVGFKIK